MNLNCYDELTEKFFGERISRDIRNIKLSSIYKKESEYFHKCLNALLKVEQEYIQKLFSDLSSKKVMGSFVEFGIFKGAWINKMYEMTQSTGLVDRQIYGFDSFKGLSAPDPKYDTPFWKEGMYSASLEEVERNVNLKKRPRIKLIDGFFSESLKSSSAQELKKVAFARIDCDIYVPAKQCLEYLSDRLSHGAILVFDDWSFNYEVGEGKAFAEWTESVPNLRFKFLFLGPWDHLHLRVLHFDKEDIFDKF